MTAREMFIDVNMKKVYEDDRILRYEDFLTREFYVIFYKKEKMFEAFTNYDCVITIRELQAINKQIEELGWNNVKD